MIITEQDAKVMWCPMARVSEMGGTQNRAGPAANFNCIASGCMMWRKIETNEFKERAEDAYRKYGTRLISDTGYCGLAGKVAS